MNSSPLLSILVAALLAGGCNQSETTQPPPPPTPKTVEPAAQPAELPPGHPPLDSGKASLPAGHPPIDMSSQTLPAGSTASPAAPQWTVPDGWSAGPPSSMRVASFTVAGSDNQTAEVSVSAFPGDVGGMLANINRWRRQIGLGPIAAEEVAGLSSPIEVNGIKGTLVDLTGNKRMLVATLPNAGNSWFFKMTGDATAVEAQKENFLAFVNSVKF